MDEVLLDNEELLKQENSITQECLHMDKCSFLMLFFLLFIMLTAVVIIIWAFIHFI